MRILRDLVEHRRMIAMVGLASRVQRLLRVKFTGGGVDSTASRKASLFLNDQRLGVYRLSHQATRHHADGQRF